MGKSPTVLRLSMSSIKMYLHCPKQWYFSHIEKLPSKTDYPRLCGQEVHRFVALLHKKHSSERKYWYKTIDTCRKAWFVRWDTALSKNENLLMQKSKDMEDKFGGLGWVCIRNYWNQNIDKPDPILIEKKYTIPLFYGVKLTGVFDQIRTVQTSWLEKRRPEIFENGQLSSGYDQTLIVDLKTGWSDYNIEENDSDLEKVRKQFAIQWDIQAAAYALLYQKHHNGKFPAGFLLYQLRNEKDNVFLVKGDLEESQKILESNIKHVVDNINNSSFPRVVTAMCSRCDFYMECNPKGNISVSLPGAMPDSITVVEEMADDEYVQLKLNFKKQKRK